MREMNGKVKALVDQANVCSSVAHTTTWRELDVG